ncbi:MAG: glycine cleavage system aminomethyltransferase GcvT [Deltaproteobacteria bacterium]|nr:glycine cleavage system aminomethyltransferase GcvT [Deltaproteobacteria bacterium]
MQLKQTSLFEEHKKLGGRLVDFGGWELPVQYTGVIGEHLACRKNAGLFDVSHMGEIEIKGADAEAFLNHLVTNNIANMSNEQAQYTTVCNPSGGIIDDVITYKHSKENFLVVVNASNTEKDFAWFKKAAQDFPCKNFTLTNESPNYTQIAIQGPRACEILQKLTPVNLSGVKTYWFTTGKILNTINAIIARTGYTGEDGFEVYTRWHDGPKVWQALLEVGQPLGLKPCGLGARDTLRLEMKYPLYGHELNDVTNPLEANLSWVVKLEKENFIGKQAILKAKQDGLTKELIGLKLIDRGIPRQGYSVFNEHSDTKIGQITSGTQSPSLNCAIGIAYVNKNLNLPNLKNGSKITVEIRGSKILAEVVPTPFYKKI